MRSVNSAAEGSDYTIGWYAFAEGNGTKASGDNSHAEGTNTVASGDSSHAEGRDTTASGSYSHAEGDRAIASAYASHAEGSGTKASGDYQHVQGRYNVEDSEGSYAFIIGNGRTDSARSNAFAIDWDGAFVFANGTKITPAQFASLLALLS